MSNTWNSISTRILGHAARAAVVAALALTAGSGSSFAQGGPVGTACAGDIAKLCAGKEHVGGAVRTCLESNKAKVSAACKTALDTTGPGKGMGGMGGMGGKR